MNRLYLAIAPAVLAAVAIPGGAYAERLSDPLTFWEGRTETVGTVKVMMKKPYRTRSIGRGEIRRDGSLVLVQRVHEEGKPAHERRWHIRKVGPGRYAGTMNEANGPVTIEEVGDRYRFRFKMKGNLAVEQWLTPLPGAKSARSVVTIRKFGVTVGRSEGTVRKIS